MNTKEIKIDCPEGFEVDKKNSTFECIKFKPIENKLPKTWEEFCETHLNVEKEYFISSASKINLRYREIRNEESDRNLLPSKELAEAMLALCQLIQLRDCYNNGWTPDYTNNNEPKYAIFYGRNVIQTDVFWTYNKVLAFKSEELCDQFFRNFKDLIEIAKPLL